jgi:arginine-tRNA-protein transferase
MPEGNGGVEVSAFAPALQHFYRTSSLPCPYLAGRTERKLVTELVGRDAGPLYDELSRAGFRRSHQLAYRPACASCDACVPVRVDATAFVPSRSMRRVARRNADLSANGLAAGAAPEQYRLFMRYQRSRHTGGEMAEMSFGDYRSMIEDSPVDTRVVEFRDERRVLLAACLADRMDDGYSAVYSFFEPAAAPRSLGSFMILWLIRQAVAEGLPYVYLGYWVASSEKMAYKARFRPLQALTPLGWRPLPA